MTTRQTGDVTRKAGDTNMNQRHKFDAPVPKDAIQSRQQSGQNLSYLDGHYIITKTNELLGHENWSYTVDRYTQVQDERKKGSGANEKPYLGYAGESLGRWFEFPEPVPRTFGEALRLANNLAQAELFGGWAE